MRQVLLYDTTLRDGMQGQGMSLSAQEKARVVRKLDELGVHFIEAGFPGSNPKELELFEMLAEMELRQASVCAFGMTRRRDTEAAEDEALRLLATGFAPVVTLVGKTWGLHLEKVTKVSREENLAMIRDSVAHLTQAGKRVIYDAEHFFDGYRDDAGYALECLRAAAEAGAENVTLCDTNGSSLPFQIAEATRAMVDGSRTPPVGIHTHNDLECAVANSLAAVQRGREPGAGHDERNRRAHRQRQPDLDPSGPPAQARLPVCLGRAACTSHRDRSLHRRAAQHHAGSRPALRRPQRFRAQGRDARRGRQRRRPDLRAHGPGRGRQRARDGRLRALGQGDRALARESSRHSARRRAGGEGAARAQGA